VAPGLAAPGLAARLGLPAQRAPRILVLSAHPDDAEIGAGGTIRRLVAERPDVTITWLILAADDARRADEARVSVGALANGAAESEVDIRDFRDGFLPFIGSGPKEALLDHAGQVHDLVIAPRRDDAHQDHRLVAELASQVFRGPPILEYEVPKWDGDLGLANLYVPLTVAEADAKVRHLLSAYPSQAGRAWFTRSTFEATLRLRGIESLAPDGLAEAFVCRKLVL
jgi:LmbE family N-acetylglucosaminyl deacetylase